MPCFKDILFIHIPKTGGTSLEKYFSRKFRIILHKKTLYGSPITYKTRFPKKYFKGLEYTLNLSLQHFSIQQIWDHRIELGVNFEDLKIITIVRNPYDKVMSGLFHKKLIHEKSNQSQVFNAINIYIKMENIDNHNKPQYTFLMLNGELVNCIILHTESLKEDLEKHSFTNFNFHENANRKIKDYSIFLNKESINLINSYYDLDFKYFGYNKII